jgi:fermentation-respiration switch protein FrsA (DUF1100 family)
MRAAGPWWLSLVALAGALLALKLLVWLAEPRLAFYPWRGEQETPRVYGIAYEALTITTSDQVRLHAWILRHPSPRAQVLFCHGNGGNLSLWLDVLAEMHRQGLTVVALDYRGYGLSAGSPSERGLYRDMDALLDRFWTRDHQEGIPVIYWGRSLGSAVAAYGATRRPPDGLILEAGFASVRSLTSNSLALRALYPFASYRFPTSAFLGRYAGPVLVIHGREDEIVPFEESRYLLDAATGRSRLVDIAGGHHNDLHLADPARYWEGVRAFLDELGRKGSRPLS